MSLKSDDCDIQDVDMTTLCGNNGDYYISLTEYKSGTCDSLRSIYFRISMSGGYSHKYPEVRKAFVAFHRAMEEAGLNGHSEQEAIIPKELTNKNWYLCLLQGENVPIFCRYIESIDMLARVENNSWGLSRIYYSPESMERIEPYYIKSKIFELLDKFLDSLVS